VNGLFVRLDNLRAGVVVVDRLALVPQVRVADAEEGFDEFECEGAVPSAV
jgi:hypothetical protein